MKKSSPRRSRTLASVKTSEIAKQFQGMEVDFDDKVTLFPVQVEKQTAYPSNVSRFRR